MSQIQSSLAPRRPGPRRARRLPVAGALALFGLCAGCGDEIGTVLEVTLSGVPPQTERVEALVSVDGVPAKAPGSFSGAIDRFSVQLPVGRKGDLELEVTALGAATAEMPGGCELADGSATAALSGQPRVDLLVPMTATGGCAAATQWDLVPGPSSADLLSLSVSAQGEAWVGSADSKIWHLSAGSWTSAFSGAADTQISGLVARGGGLVFTETKRQPSDAADATTLHYQPPGDGPGQAAPVRGRMYGLSLPAAAALTGGLLVAGDGGVLTWSVGQMPSLPLPETSKAGSPLLAVHAFAALGKRRAVAVGKDGRVQLGGGDTLSFDPQEASDTGKTLLGVFALGPADIWAVGEGRTVTHYDGTRWQSTTLADLPGDGTLRGVWGSSAGAVWAVGTGGAIVRWDGASWRRQPSPTSKDLYAISGIAAISPGRDEIYAVGASGAVLRLARQQ